MNVQRVVQTAYTEWNSPQFSFLLGGRSQCCDAAKAHRLMPRMNTTEECVFYVLMERKERQRQCRKLALGICNRTRYTHTINVSPNPNMNRCTYHMLSKLYNSIIEWIRFYLMFTWDIISCMDGRIVLTADCAANKPLVWSLRVFVRYDVWHLCNRIAAMMIKWTMHGNEIRPKQIDLAQCFSKPSEISHREDTFYKII